MRLYGSTAAHLDVIRRQDTGSLDDPAQDEIDGDTTGHTDEPGHGRVSVGRALLVQDRSDRLDLAVGTLDDEGVLQVNKVDLVGFVLHEVLETGAESVEQVASGLGGLVREESELLELGQEDVGLGRGERGQGSELLDDGAARSSCMTDQLPSSSVTLMATPFSYTHDSLASDPMALAVIWAHVISLPSFNQSLASSSK
jgi:hypothetical protein